MSQSKTLYLPPDEKLNLVLTGCFFVLAVGEIFLHWGAYLIRGRYDFFGVLTAVISFQTLHVMMTYVGLLFMPEFKRWIYLKSGGRVAVFWCKVVAAIAGLGIVSYFVADQYHHSAGMSKMTFETVGFFTYWLSVHHRALQTYGIGVANRQMLGHDGSESLDQQLRKAERLSLYLLILLVGVLVAMQMGYVNTALEGIGFAPTRESLNLFGKVVLGLAVAVALVIFGIGLLEWRLRPGQDHRAKIAHTLRFLFYPLITVSYFSLWAMESLHGIEYVSVWRKLFASSENNRFSWSRRTLAALAMILIFYAIIYIPVWMQFTLPQAQVHTPLERALFAFSTSILYVHYYFDHVLFKMRDPVSRAVTGSLLTAVPIRPESQAWAV